MKALLLVLACLVAPLHAQTYQTVGGETDVITFNQATTYSFGALSGTTTTTKTLCSATTRNCFKSFTATAGVPVVFNSNFVDPAPGVTKIVQVLQTTTAQTGTTTHNGVKTPWTVPATAVPPPVVTPPPVVNPPTTSIILTLSCTISAATINCTLPATFVMPKAAQ